MQRVAVIGLISAAGWAHKAHAHPDDATAPIEQYPQPAQTLIDWAIESRRNGDEGLQCQGISDLSGVISATADVEGIDHPSKRAVLEQMAPRVTIALELYQRHAWGPEEFQHLEKVCLDHLYLKGIFGESDNRKAAHEAGHVLFHAALDPSKIRLKVTIDPTLRTGAHVSSNFNQMPKGDNREWVMHMLLAGELAEVLLGERFERLQWEFDTHSQCSDEVNCTDEQRWITYAMQHIGCERASQICQQRMLAVIDRQARTVRQVLERNRTTLGRLIELILHYRELSEAQVLPLLESVDLADVTWKQSRPERRRLGVFAQTPENLK